MSNIGYSRYDEPQEWGFDDLVPEDELGDMKHKMKNILDIVYGDSDIEDLEYELESLAAYFDLKLPPKAFKIARIKEQNG